MTFDEYCQRDVELCSQLARIPNSPLPSLDWLCANLDRWYISHGQIVFTK